MLKKFNTVDDKSDLPETFNLDSLVAQIVKILPAMQETQVRSLGWGDPLEKGMATYSSILIQKIRKDNEAITT